MRQRWSWTATLGIIFALVAGLVLPVADSVALAQQGQPIRFGAVLVLTGDGAAYGNSQREGLELARDTINAAGGVLGSPIEIIFEDSRGEKTDAVNATLKLINRDRVLGIIGPTYSGEMFAAGPAADRARVVIMGISTTAVGIGDIGPYVFRNSLPEEGVIPTTVRVAHRHLGYKTAALLYSNNNDFTASAARTFERELNAIGAEILTIETFHDGDTDFRAQLTKVLNVNPDVLVVSALYKEAALLLQQARQLGLNQPVIGGNGFNSPELIRLAGEAVEGAIVGSPWFPGRDHPLVREFVTNYRERYGRIPDQFAAQAYDALFLFAEAVRRAGSGTDRRAFRDALAEIRNFEGVTGVFSFDEKGDPDMEATILQVVNGEYVELK